MTNRFWVSRQDLKTLGIREWHSMHTERRGFPRRPEREGVSLLEDVLRGQHRLQPL